MLGIIIKRVQTISISDCKTFLFQTLEGSLVNGEVLFSGGTNWCMIGRSHLPKGGKSTP